MPTKTRSSYELAARRLDARPLEVVREVAVDVDDLGAGSHRADQAASGVKLRWAGSRSAR